MDDIWRRPERIAHAAALLRSFREVVGRDLVMSQGDPEADARNLFRAAFAVLSHGLQDDPVLNYGNAVALRLWEMDFDTFTRTPSRLTAEPMLREERARLLQTAAEKGYIDNYAGVRISATGRRFTIENAIIWNVSDEDGAPLGQAATFGRWTYV